MSSPSNIIKGTIADLPAWTGLPLVLIGLGSNLELGAETSTMILRRAFIALTALSDFPVITSSLWRTAPVDCPPDSPDFVNAVAALLPRSMSASTADAEALLKQLQQIERDFGRVRGDLQNAARTLDLDLLACGSLQSDTAVLTLPHPRSHQRAFVLTPLVEVAPGYILPGQLYPVEELLKVTLSAGQVGLDVQRTYIDDSSVTL